MAANLLQMQPASADGDARARFHGTRGAGHSGGADRAIHRVRDLPESGLIFQVVHT
jgi:hypothetical protein